MTISITWLGHSAFEVKVGSHVLLIDPFITDNPVATVRADSLMPNFILVSHGHGDHLGDTVEIAKRTNATCIGMYELTSWLGAKGVLQVHGMNYGGKHQFAFGSVKITLAWHSSTMPDGTTGGLPAGFILELEGKKIYFAGDTALFSDMKLIGEEGLDLAILPVGDNYTMGPEDSIKAINYLKPQRVIPCHYNTFPVIEIDTQQWVKSVNEKTEAIPVILKVGESAIL